MIYLRYSDCKSSYIIDIDIYLCVMCNEYKRAFIVQTCIIILMVDVSYIFQVQKREVGGFLGEIIITMP